MKLWVLALPVAFVACTTPYPCAELSETPAPGGGCYYDEYDAGSDAAVGLDAATDASEDAAITEDAESPVDAGPDANEADAGVDGGDASSPPTDGGDSD